MPLNANRSANASSKILSLLLIACILFLTILPCVVANAQGEMPDSPKDGKQAQSEKLPAKPKHDALKAFAETDSDLGSQKPGMNDLGEIGTAPMDAATRTELSKESNQLVMTKFKREIWSYQYEQKLYEWQFISSKIVFGMVIVLVICGMYFSWLQFRHIMQDDDPKVKKRVSKVTTSASHPSAAPERAAPAEAAPGETPHDSDEKQVSETYNIEASATGFKISTSMFGVAILAFSLIFFYLYLQFIYPIR